MSDRAEWQAWLEYFLNGVAHQAEDALDRARRINDLLSEWRKAVAGAASRTTAQLVDLLAENPYWTVKRVAGRMEVAFTTAQRAVEKLEVLAILTRTSAAKRDRVYVAKAILDILEQPTGLQPRQP